jgi:hypothetical protein
MDSEAVAGSSGSGVTWENALLDHVGNGTGPEISEPISPELILVDPELGQRARKALPPPGAFGMAAPPISDKTREGAQPVAVEPPEDLPSLLGGVKAVVLTGALVVLGTVMLLGIAEFAREGPTLGSQPSQRAANGSVGPARTERPPARSRTGQSRTPKTAQPQTNPPTRATHRTRAAERRPVTPARERTIAISWKRVARARSYWVQVYRLGLPGARKVLEAITREPRMTLPARPTLRRGRYRWEVWPQFGARRTREYTKLAAKGVFVIGRR